MENLTIVMLMHFMNLECAMLERITECPDEVSTVFTEAMRKGMSKGELLTKQLEKGSFFCNGQK